MGGSGGGQPFFATASGTQPDALRETVSKIFTLLVLDIPLS